VFRIDLDLSTLLEAANELGPVANEAMQEAGRRLAAMTHAHIVEEAAKKLHTRREMFVEGLKHFQLDSNVFVVNLDAKVRWIDDGMPSHSMLDDLLGSKKAKTAKDGSRYLVVPFRHGPKGPTQMTPAEKTLLDTIKGELKSRKIPYGKVERHANGDPKLGLLHRLNINNAPVKTANKPGQGKGPVGSVMQGPTGIPLLQGINIYQREVKDKQGKTGVRRDIMTFRVASSKHYGQGRWDHPGIEGVRLLDEAYDWARRQWEQLIAPEVVARISKNF
jgi:hypothetical protein